MDVLCVSPKAILVLAPKSASFTVPVSTSTFPPLISLRKNKVENERIKGYNMRRYKRIKEFKKERTLRL